MSSSVYIISFKFAPGLMKEFHLIGENIRRHGGEVSYIVSRRYRDLGMEMPGTVYVNPRPGILGLLRETIENWNLKSVVSSLPPEPPAFVLFYNPHPLNPFLARYLKSKYPNACVALYLHDPYKPDKSPYGAVKGAYYHAVEWIQGLTLRKMDVVISPSEYSAKLLVRYFPWYKNKRVLAPLLVPDSPVVSSKGRKYFSLVGNAHKATGHDRFVNLINYSAAKNLGFRFAMISSSNIAAYTKRLSKKALNAVEIVNRKTITDAEIYGVISSSYAVFRLDSDITQSGVVPVCYMNSTPLIVPSAPGFIQHVQHGVNGWHLPLNYSEADMVAAMDSVLSNFERLSKNARVSYEKVWAGRNWDRYYAWLLDLLHM